MSDPLLEQDLKNLFIQYGPTKVMETWADVLQQFRDALKLYDTPTRYVAPIKLSNEIIEPLTRPTVQPPKPVSTPDKDEQKSKMKAHKEKIQQRRQELAAQGVIPETLLTEGNLRKWITEEKKNYWKIAEETGCNDTDISAKAKVLDIQSDVAKMIRFQKAKKQTA